MHKVDFVPTTRRIGGGIGPTFKIQSENILPLKSAYRMI